MKKSPLFAGGLRVGIAIAMVLGLLLAAAPTVVQASDCVSTGGTAGSPLLWKDTTTWDGCGGLVPKYDDTVTIRSGDYVIMNDNNANVENLTVNGILYVGNDPENAQVLTVGSDDNNSFIQINNGGKITFNPDYGYVSNSIILKGSLMIKLGGTLTLPVGGLTIDGDFTNEGTFNNATATTTFAGTTHLFYTSGHEITFFSIVINPSSALYAPLGIGESPAPGDTNFNLKGNWTNNGTFYHSQSGTDVTTVTFNGVAGLQNIQGTSTTDFYRLVNRISWGGLTGLNYILNDESDAGATATIFVNNAVFRRQVQITGAGEYTFALASGPNYSIANPKYTYNVDNAAGSHVVIDVTSAGNLVSLVLDRVDQNHPGKVGMQPDSGYGIGWVSYWRVTSYCNTGGISVPCPTQGTYAANITLPHGDYNFFRTDYAWPGAGAKDCRWSASEFYWSCNWDVRSTYSVEQDSLDQTTLTAYPTSDWAVGSDQPTAVDAVLSSNVLPSLGIQLVWTVTDQSNVRGYNVLRSTTEGDPNPARLNPAEIAVQNPGSTGIVYSFDDLTALPSVHYYYTLEKVDFSSTPVTLRTLDYEWFKTFIPVTIKH